MRLPADGRSFRFLFSVSTLTAIFALFVCVLFAAPDGNERVRLFEFFGRFHPISVHLPIALLLLVPLFELAGRRREFSYLPLAVDFVLGVAVLAAISAATLGWLLARNGADTGPLVQYQSWIQHRDRAATGKFHSHVSAAVQRRSRGRAGKLEFFTAEEFQDLGASHGSVPGRGI